MSGLPADVLREPASEEYESEIRAMLLEKEEFQQSAAQAVSTAEERLETLEQQYTRQVRQMTLAQDRGLDDQAFLDVLQETQQKKQAVQAELDKAREFLRSRTIAWDRISAAIDETRNLAEVWDKVGLDERRTLLDWWVLDVLIAVDPIPGMKKANEKTAIVTLRSAPDAPRHFTIGEASSARPSSSGTNGSASDEKAPAKAALASDASTLPSAQAACARTNGAGSDSADESTGTASGDPQLPRPTQTLRANPGRPARRMAEPLENECQAASSNAVSSNSMSDGEAVPGWDDEEPGSGCTPNGGSPADRAAYAGSDAGAENLRENGHTSWEDCHP